LEQRLKAQNIPVEKRTRGLIARGANAVMTSFVVLQDVIVAMFEDQFLTEMFRPQPIYSNESTRQIFHRLAHSSIMRLNPTSMDKVTVLALSFVQPHRFAAL